MNKKTKNVIDAESAVTIDNRIELLASVVKDGIVPVEFGADGKTVVVNVKKRLSLFERSRMVEEMVSYCFIDKLYAPYMFNFALDIKMLSFYTDLPIDAIGGEDAYRLTQNVEFVRKVRDVIEDNLGSIFDDAIKLVEWKREQTLRSSKADELYDTVKNFVGGLDDLLNGVAENMGDSTSLPGILDAIQKITDKDEAAIAHGVLDFQQVKGKQAKKPVRKTTK